MPRLGVLYLFSRLSVTPGLVKLTLDGGLNIASHAMKVGGSSKEDQKRFKNARKGSSVVGALGGKIEDKLVKKHTAKNVYFQQGAMPSVAAGAKVTLVTSEQIKQEAEQAAALPTGPVWRTSGTRSVNGRHAGGKEAAPFVKSGFDLARAIGQTLKAAVTRFKAWTDSKNGEVAQGHPATVVDSITRAMTRSLFEGLWGVLKGAGGIAMQATSFGAGAIVNMMIAAGELLIKFIWKLVETVRFSRFCAEPRSHWEYHLDDGLHRQPFAFSEWYRATALNLPLIAVLTLNTRICGDKMRYLTMFNVPQPRRPVRIPETPGRP